MADSVGTLLREAREARGLTLADVERATRIRIKYLAAIEADEFQVIPSAVQARGFLRNYARHVGLEPDEVLALFEAPPRRPSLGDLARALIRPRAARPAPPPEAARTAAQETAAPPRQPAAPPAPPRPRRTFSLGGRRLRWFSADVIVGLIVAAALLGFFVWGGARLGAVLFQATAQATVVELGRPTAIPTATLATLQPTAVPPTVAATVPPPAALVNVPVSLRFEQTAWVLVIVDGAEVFRGMVQPGNVQDYLGQSSVEVATGNAAGVRVNYGGVDYGPLGGFGEVAYRIYTVAGVITPTPSATPEVTETSTPRPPTETQTPRPTPTAQGSPEAGTPTPPPTATVRPTETVPPSPTASN